MAANVRVSIHDRAIITVLNGPGGGVYRWRDEVGSEIKSVAEGLAPTNDPLNCVHRGGVYGLYKAGFDWDRRGSRGHYTIARVTNDQPYAVYVEWGRSASYEMQIFSWTAWGGKIKRIGGPKPVTTKNPITGKYDRWDWERKKWKGRGFQRYISRLTKWEDAIPYAGDHTGPQAGKHILGRATVAVLGGMGISARVDM